MGADGLNTQILALSVLLAAAALGLAALGALCRRLMPESAWSPTLATAAAITAAWTLPFLLEGFDVRDEVAFIVAFFVAGLVTLIGAAAAVMRFLARWLEGSGSQGSQD